MLYLGLIAFPLLVFALLDLVIFSSSGFVGQTQSIGGFGQWNFSSVLMDPSTLFTILIGAIVVVAILSGLSVFGSGLNAVSVETLLKVGAFMAVFVILSATPIAILISYGQLGQMFVIFLSLMYFAGVILSVRGGG